MHWNAAFPEYFKNKYEILKKRFSSFKSLMLVATEFLLTCNNYIFIYILKLMVLCDKIPRNNWTTP